MVLPPARSATSVKCCYWSHCRLSVSSREDTYMSISVNCGDFWFSWFSPGAPNIQTSKHPNIQTSKQPNIQTSKHPNMCHKRQSRSKLCCGVWYWPLCRLLVTSLTVVDTSTTRSRDKKRRYFIRYSSLLKWNKGEWLVVQDRKTLVSLCLSEPPTSLERTINGAGLYCLYLRGLLRQKVGMALSEDD